MSAPIEHNASPQFRFYNFRSLTWRSASIHAKVPFDNVRGVWGCMTTPFKKRASLTARKPGTPTYISAWRVTANQSSIDNSATIRILGRMQNGAGATAAAARRAVFSYVVYGF